MRRVQLVALLGILPMLAGCGVGSRGTMGNTGGGAAPLVVGVGIQTNGMATNRAIDVQFSKAMNAASVNANTFLLTRAADGTRIAASVTYDATNFVASLKPNAPLAVNTAYNGLVTSGAADVAGDHLAANFAFSFVTRGSSDTSDISVYQTLPTAGQTGVSVSTLIQVVFSEGAASASVNSATFVVKDSSGNLVSGTVKYDIVTNYATFTPATALAAGMTYTVTINGVTDLAGEPMAAPYTFSFVTAGGVAQVQDLVYETDTTLGNILGWVFDPTGGTLTSTPGSPYPSGLEPYGMVLSPDGATLYAIMAEQPPSVHGSNCFNFHTQVISYSIDHVSGSLTREQTVDLNGFCAKTSGAIDPAGHFLYVGESNATGSAGMVDVLSLGVGGQMTLVSGSPAASPAIPISLVVDGNYLFGASSNFGTDGLITYRLDPATGAVQYQSAMSMPGQQGIAVSRSGGTLYSVAQNSGLISEYTVDPRNGTLTLRGTVASGAFAGEIVVDPSGQYAAVAASNGINLFSVSSAGDLTAEPGSPFGGGPAGWVFFDSSGTHLVALQANVQVYGVNNGALQLQASTTGTYNPATVTTLVK